jgi:hypothetical protein
MVNMFGSRILVFGEKVNGYRGMNDPDSFALFLGGEQDILTFADWRDRRRVGLRKNGFRDIRSYFGVNERMGFAISGVVSELMKEWVSRYLGVTFYLKVT